MSKGDHHAPENGKAGKAGKVRSILFPAGEQAAVVSQPGNGALDNPSSFVSAQRASVLSHGVGPPVGTVRGDHLEPQFFERRVQRVSVVSLVANHSSGLKLGFYEAEGFLHHVRLPGIGRGHGKAMRKPPRINDKLAASFPCLYG